MLGALVFMEPRHKPKKEGRLEGMAQVKARDE
jgi:hypothetical protein